MEKRPCRECGGPLEPVTYPSGSLLNEDQWRSIRAGDYYCRQCPPAQPSDRYRYFWAHELPTLMADD